MSVIDSLGGRKLVAAGVIIVIAAVVMSIKGDLPVHFKEVLEWVFTAFVTGNAIEYFGTAMQTNAEAKKVAAEKVETPKTDTVQVDQAKSIILSALQELNNNQAANAQEIFNQQNKLLDSNSIIIQGIQKLLERQGNR